MRFRKIDFFLLAFLLVPFLSAAQTTKQCVNDANSLREQCVSACVDQSKTDKIACIVPDNECGAGCGNIFLACTEPVDIARDLCFDQCEADLAASQSSCGTSCGCTPNVNCGANSCYFLCVEAPLRVRGTCKVDCTLAGRPARKACRVALKKCAKNC